MKIVIKKLASVKGKIGKMSKEKTNPFHNSKYFDINALLEHVEPLLQDEGLILLQPIDDGVVTTKIFDIESGEAIESSIPMSGESNPQKVGSMITYYRRYTLQSLLAIQADDDDGNKASGYEKKPAGQSSGTAEKNEPTTWLNVTLKGTEEMTKEFKNVLEGIAAGKITSLRDVRQVYRVSKVVAAEIEKHLK